MSRCTALAVFLLLATVSLARAQEPFKPEIIERGKKATALVQVGVLWEGSAFCIDKSGLFVTTSHVLEKALESTVEIRLLLDNGLKSERSLRAKLVRRDDRLDLALLQVDPTLKAEDFRDLGRFTKALAQLKQDAGLTALELGKDADLAELAPIATLGCSSRPLPPGGRVRPLPVVVVMNHITALRRDHGELVAIQVDSQLDAGFSGGPVLDRSGRAIGVVAAAQSKTAMNRAIPAGRLAEFLAAPKIVFDPPPLTDIDRHRQVNWTIKVEPTTRDGLPKGTSVAVTLEDEPTKRRSFAAEAGNAGTFQVLLSPISPEMQGVQLAARFRTGNPTVTIRTRDRETTIPGDPTITLQMRDQEVTVGGKKVRLGELRAIFGGANPRAETVGGQTLSGPIEGLGQAQIRSRRVIETVDLRNAAEIRISKYDLPVSEVVAVVEARQGLKLLATLRRRIRFNTTPPAASRAGPSFAGPSPAPSGPRPPAGDGVLRLAGNLNVDGVPLGAGRQIQPPSVPIPEARLVPDATATETPPLERLLESKISDVAAGGGGRYLLLTLRDARKIAVFDVNVADIVATIPLPSPNVLVAAGAKRFLMAMPDENRLELWDLATRRRIGNARPMPIGGKLRALALGSDSEGPALAVWYGSAAAFGYIERLRASFVDLDSLAVLRLGPPGPDSPRGPVLPGVADSGGSFALGSMSEDVVHVRASAGGGLFSVWQTGGGLGASQTFRVHGRQVHRASSENFGLLVPGPDGRSVFTTGAGRVYADGRYLGRARSPGAERQWEPEVTLSTPDPAYYLSIAHLPLNAPDRESGGRRAAVTVSVHNSLDGARLVTAHGFDEMAAVERGESFRQHDFTTEKRFHFVPAAHLLVTIPPENNRLVLRRLDIEESLYHSSGRPLVAASPPLLLATAGQVFEHRVQVWSRQGGVSYELAVGPEGMEVTPEGVLTWAVPPRPRTDEVTAILTARDATGQEIFQSLQIHLKGAEVPSPAPQPGVDLAPDDGGLLRLGARLNVSGRPLGAGRGIRPPRVAIPLARLTPALEKGSKAPLVRLVGGTIGDVTVGGGGRYLLLTLNDARKVAVFDVNAGDIVKTIPLASPHALIAAGASKMLIVYPEEQVFQRWDLASLEREGGSYTSPVDGWIKALALGSDSDGPALALWYPRARGHRTYLKATRYYILGPEARFSFIDIERLAVPTIGSIDGGKAIGIKATEIVSPSGGSCMIQPDFTPGRGDRVDLLASAGGDWFQGAGLPGGSFLVAHGDHLRIVKYNNPYVLAGLALTPGVGFSGVDESIPWGSRPTFIRSADPAYYLGISAPSKNASGTQAGAGKIHDPTSPAQAVTASVHAAGDGTLLFTVHGLDEMIVPARTGSPLWVDLTIDQRFHLVPAARLLVTIPPSNDRLVLRHLDIEEILDRPGSEELVMLSRPTLTAAAGSVVEHRLVARSRNGRVRYELIDGPDGLGVTSDGVLTWGVPVQLRGEEVMVVVSVTAPSGGERLHTIKILVE